MMKVQIVPLDVGRQYRIFDNRKCIFFNFFLHPRHIICLHRKWIRAILFLICLYKRF